LDLLPVAEFAINSAKNRSTGYTPFFLNYGREPETPAAFLASRAPALTDRTSNALAEEVAERTRKALAHAKECIARAQQQQTEYANRSRKEATFTRGDKVLLSTNYLSRRTDEGGRKLDPPLDWTLHCDRGCGKGVLPTGTPQGDEDA
jgi:hypothetical protein